MARRPNSAQGPIAAGESYGENRRMWAELGGTRVILYRVPGDFMNQIPEGDVSHVREYEEVANNPYGEEIQLSFASGRKLYTLRLTGLTEKELDALQDMVNYAVTQARPIVQAKDKISQELFDEQGIDSFSRLYRGVPKVVVRKGEEPLYTTSLRRRPFGILEVDGRIRIEPVAGAVEREVAQREQANEGSDHG